MEIVKFRDLSIINLGDKNLVVANDSSGSIGSKENDALKVDPEVVGYHAAQVALMEIIAYGAKPVLIINNLCVEMNPTGKRIIDGVVQAMNSVGMDTTQCLNGSTEENFITTMTGIGITVLGVTDIVQTPIFKSEKRDLVAVLGMPLVGQEIIDAGKNEVMNAGLLKKVRSLPYIKEILPVGSTGIRNELKNIERDAKSKALIFKTELDLKKSSGPSTSVLVTLKEEDSHKLSEDLDIKTTPLAILI